MRPDAVRALDPWARVAIVVWAAILLVLGVRVAVRPLARNLYPTWATAGGDWLSGSDQLYRRTGQRDNLIDTFRYTPFVAATLVPWHFLPENVGGVLWRFFNGGVFLGAAWWWLSAAAPVALSRRRQAIFFLLLAPLALTNLNNGQVNSLVIGCLLASLASAAGERWWLSSAFVALATALKVYPLAVGLLMVACYPRQLAGRLLVALAAVGLLPFVLQRPEYVLTEYREWQTLLGVDDRSYWPLHMTYRDLWLLIRVVHLDTWITPSTYRILQVAGGAGCAALCVLGRWRGQEPRRVLASVLALGCCWMILLGPATESATFIVLAPALAWGLVAEPHGIAKGLTLAASGLLAVCLLAGLFRNTAAFHGLGLHPLAALLFAAGCVSAALRRTDAGAVKQLRTDEKAAPLAA